MSEIIDKRLDLSIKTDVKDVDEFKDLYYDITNILTYNRLVNYIVGGRGIGKTYSVKKFCIKQNIKFKFKFVWIRRFENELIGMENFFSKVQKEFPDKKFKAVKNKCWYFYMDNEVIGYAMELAKWNTYKGIEFDDVYTIVFDEFLIEPESLYHYMRDEPKPLLNMIDTILRVKEDPRVRCICMANITTVTNVYFTYFKISPDISQEISIWKDGQILLQFPDSSEFAQKRIDTTRFGKLIEGTDYGEMALHNKSVHDNNDFIEKKTKNAEHLAVIIVNRKKIGIWRDANEGKVFLSTMYDKTNRFVYALTLKDMTPNIYYTKNWKKETYLKLIIDAMKHGYLYYDNMNIKNMMIDMFSKMSL